MPSPPAPRPLEGWSAEQLSNYHQLCRRMIREQGGRLKEVELELDILSRDARTNKFWAGAGVVLFGLGLAATPVVGLAAGVLAGFSGAASLQPVIKVVRGVGERERLRLEMADLERSLPFWANEQTRILRERERRKGGSS